MQKLYVFALVLGLFFIPACRPPSITGSPLNEKGLLTIVSSPAGTNYWKTADPRTGELDAGRPINYLPLPFNVAYVPKTKDPGSGNQNLEVILLAEHFPEGAVVRVNPIGVLDLEGKAPIILAVPSDSSSYFLPLRNFQEFMIEYAPMRNTLEDWLEHYQGLSQRKEVAWRDERAAAALLQEWLLE